MEKDEPLFIAITVSHFLEQFYSIPTKFDITRFAPPRNEHKQAGAFALSVSVTTPASVWFARSALQRRVNVDDRRRGREREVRLREDQAGGVRRRLKRDG